MGPREGTIDTRPGDVWAAAVGSIGLPGNAC